MKFRKTHLFGFILLLSSTMVSAQYYIGVQSGIANLINDVHETESAARIGVSIKAGYIYNYSNNIGIGSGIEFTQYNQNVRLNSVTDVLSNYEVDLATSAFAYNVSTKNYREKQVLYAAQIPLFVQYKQSINKGTTVNFRAGIKYFLPLSYRIFASADQVNATAYYPDLNLTIEDLPEYGIGQQSNYSAKGHYDTRGVLMSTYEIGFTFDMGRDNSLYTAMTLDYGYGSILDNNTTKSYIGYNPNAVTNRKANGLYNIHKNAQVRPVAFGLTLGWNFK